MAHVTLDLSKYDALTAYKGLPDEKEENPARFFPDTTSVRRCVRERMSVMGLDACLLYTSPSPRDRTRSRMPSSA